MGSHYCAVHRRPDWRAHSSHFVARALSLRHDHVVQPLSWKENELAQWVQRNATACGTSRWHRAAHNERVRDDHAPTASSATRPISGLDQIRKFPVLRQHVKLNTEVSGNYFVLGNPLLAQLWIRVCSELSQRIVGCLRYESRHAVTERFSQVSR